MARIPERDPNHAKCNTCKGYKEHVDSGAISNDGRLIFIADRGTRWVGNTCPDCVDVGLIEAGKAAQKVIPELININGVPRVCRDCRTRVLPLRRYRICEFCQPVLNSEVDDEYLLYDEYLYSDME